MVCASRFAMPIKIANFVCDVVVAGHPTHAFLCISFSLIAATASCHLNEHCERRARTTNGREWWMFMTLLQFALCSMSMNVIVKRSLFLILMCTRCKICIERGASGEPFRIKRHERMRLRNKCVSTQALFRINEFLRTRWDCACVCANGCGWS